MWPFLGSSLLFLGSLAASGVAFYGVHKSNETNQAAITAADNRAVIDRAEARERDFRAWQRDTFLQVSTEVIEAAMHGEEDYRRAVTLPLDSEMLNTLEQAGRKLAVCFGRLRMIGAHGAADRCRDIRIAINNRRLAQALVEANSAQRHAMDEEPVDAEVKEAAADARATFEALLHEVAQARGNFGQTVEYELRWITLSEAPPDNLPDVTVGPPNAPTESGRPS